MLTKSSDSDTPPKNDKNKITSKNKIVNKISTNYDFGAFEDNSNIFVTSANPKNNNIDVVKNSKNIVNESLNSNSNTVASTDIINSNTNPFETHYSKKTIKKNVRTAKIKNLLDDISFQNVPKNASLEDLEMNDYYKSYAHYNKDKNWDYNNYFNMTEHGLRSWKEISNFLNTLNTQSTKYTMNDFDIFIMKNNISPMWEDVQNKQGSIMSVKVSSNEDAYSIFKFLFLNICNNSLLKYTEKTLNKTNGISFSTKVIENINITSYIVKVWFRENFCHSETSIFNPHINERLEADDYSVKFKQIRPEF